MTHSDRDGSAPRIWCSNAQRHEPHWHVIQAGGITFAQGQCHGTPAGEYVESAPAGLPLHEATDRDGDNVPSDVERRTVCAKCGQRAGLFHKDCDGEWVEEVRNVTPWRRVPHEHRWVRHQNVTSRGYRMPAYEACSCGNARPAEEWA